MKLDPKRLSAEADAHTERMASPLWTASEGDQDGSWLAPLIDVVSSGANAPQPSPSQHVEPLDAPSLEGQPRLEALEQAVQHLAEAVSRRPAEVGDVAAWLEAAGGDPHTYDAPDGERQGVCVRILPGTYQRLRLLQSRVGLRTRAAAWEFLLRLGLAATERLPRGQPP